MRICHITSVHPRYDIRIYKKECVSLAEAGFETYLIVNDNKGDEVVSGVNIVSTGICIKNRFQRLLSIVKIKKLAIQIDARLYHFHDPELLPLANKLKKSGKKVIFDSHEFYRLQILQKEYLPIIVRKNIAFLYSKYEKYILSKIDAVVTPCKVNGQNYFKNIAKRTVFIDNYPLWFSNESSLDEGKSASITVCCPGSLTKNRGVNETIDACEGTNTKLILAGPTEEDVKEKINMSSYVEYRGVVDSSEIKKIYSESSIGISLIHNVYQYEMIDNLPTKVYEYMMAGLPVIMTRRRFTEHLMKEESFGLLVDPTDVEEVKKAIIYLGDNPYIARKLGETGKKLAQNKFCWDVEKQKLINLYNDLLLKC